jgi:hypothetical protein
MRLAMIYPITFILATLINPSHTSGISNVHFEKSEEYVGSSVADNVGCDNLTLNAVVSLSSRGN